MRLLLDENLSPRLVRRLGELFPGLHRVREVGLAQSLDASIWRYAQEQGFILVTADDDFRQRVLAEGPPPQVVLVERCDFPLSEIEELLRRNAVRIAEFAQSEEGLLVLRR